MPVVTVALILANLAVFLAGPALETCWLDPACVALRPLLTSLFAHKDIVHLGGNMATLGIFGTLVEKRIGGVRFLLAYLTAGVSGGLLHSAVSETLLVGASGAVYGILAVTVSLYPRTLAFVLALALTNVWASLQTEGEASFGAHLGGLLGGVLVAWILRLTTSEEVA